MYDLTILEDNILPVPLNKSELHSLAMNIVGKDLEKDNFEFISGNRADGTWFLILSIKSTFSFSIKKTGILFLEIILLAKAVNL